MQESRKYATATIVLRQLLKADGSGYVTSADWTPTAGDVKYLLTTDMSTFSNSGAGTNVATLPSYTGAGGWWVFPLAAAELTSKWTGVIVVNAALKSDGFGVETYGNASAMYQSDFSAPDILTGDAYAEATTINTKLGTPAGASVSADIAAVKSDTGTILTDTATILADVNTGAGAIYNRLGAPAGASIAADIAAATTDIVAVNTKLGTPAGASVSADIAALPAGVWANGTRTLTRGIRKNTPFPNFAFTMFDSTTKLPKPNLTVTATRNIDGAGDLACANPATEIGNGRYSINFASTDVNGDAVATRFTAPGADDLNILIITE